MGTTATETLSVAGNIFVSQVGPVASPGKAGLWFTGALIQSCAPSPRVMKGGCPMHECMSGGPFCLGHAREDRICLAPPTTLSLGCLHQLRD